MKNLKDILYKVAIESVVGSTSVSVNALQFNSKLVEENDVFFAIKGSVVECGVNLGGGIFSWAHFLP